MRLNKQPWILTGLLVIFLSPVLGAWWCYHTGGLKQLPMTNQGQLVHDAVRIDAWPHAPMWRLVYVAPDGCDAHCVQQVMTLAHVRLALGRHLYGLALWLFIPQGVVLPGGLLAQLHDIDVHVLTLPVIPMRLTQAAVWVMNAQGEGVLTYQDAKDPQAIFSDLKHLSHLWDR